MLHETEPCGKKLAEDCEIEPAIYLAEEILQEGGAEEMENKKWMCLWTVSNNWRKMNGAAAAIIFIALISMAPAITLGIQVK